jgi:hypothetical protein
MVAPVLCVLQLAASDNATKTRLDHAEYYPHVGGGSDMASSTPSVA